MKIYIDAMGGDNAPKITVEGVLEALTKHSQIEIELAGPLDKVEPVVNACFQGENADLRKRLFLTDCQEIIENCESPVMAVRKKVNSAIVDGMLKLRDKKVDAFVSAGSTGAVLASGMFRLGRIRGIDRPALAPLMPNGEGFYLLIDCGANVDCRPEHLHQFALMGHAYMQGVRAIEKPRIGLVNIGAEVEKGNALAKEAHELLAKEEQINFVGNVEARDITHDQADVIVCDGFVGNIILKFMEGVAGTILTIVKKELLADTRSAIGAWLAKPAFKRVKKTLDYSEVGGAPLLGVKGNVIKAHGSSNAHAFACAITQAVLMSEGKIPEKIEGFLQK